MNFSWPNVEVGWKMANGQLLFLALIYLHYIYIIILQAEAEEALAAALPALEEARIALSDLEKSDVTEIRLKNICNEL